MKNVTRVRKFIYYILNRTIWKSHFSDIGKRSVVFSPLQLDCQKSVFVGDNTFISSFAWILTLNGGEVRFGNKCTVGHFCHVAAYSKVIIHDEVLVADKVFISDCTHSFDDISMPIITQDVLPIHDVEIGEGSWIGENVCICGANIGKHCVIGANSVVTTDIPDYCIAVGAPARVVKIYDLEKETWVRKEKLQ